MSRIFLSPPHLTGEEVQYLQEAINSNWVAPAGPHLRAFENEIAQLVGVHHAVAVTSGTAALHLALRVLDIGPGDEVWSPTLTFVGAVNPIVYQGATPVFLDSDPVTWNLDAQLVAEQLNARAKINRLPKALIVVHLYGQTADMDPICDVCRHYGVTIVEDAAEAIGATYKGRQAGSLGDIAILSFNGNKIVTTSGGGMVLSNRQDWVDRAHHLGTQAREPGMAYLHKDIGYNYRLSNLLAGVGRAQLKQLDYFIARRRAVFERYRQALGDLPGIQFKEEPGWGTSTRWLSCLTIDPKQAPCTRDELCNSFAAADIEVRPVWKPMHRQPIYHGCKMIGGKVANQLEDTGLCLPSSSALTNDQQDRVIEVMRAAFAATV
ncbi:MAG: aminotransferase class I/II-fold pyridoxal phosphate-dependent enzyme [Verrucomicrobia bacterium]|nr:aminotransferase class I/II-fold pyridoxal phosphate-dependent enzyme [Verrucomicrobiota bacterium]